MLTIETDKKGHRKLSHLAATPASTWAIEASWRVDIYCGDKEQTLRSGKWDEV